MGFILDQVGNISVEQRRESFIIHPNYGYDHEGNEHDDSLGVHWRENSHPEFLLEDLPDLIQALQELQESLRRMATAKEIKEQDERPFRKAGYPAGPVSMGGGRKLAPYGRCSKSPDGMHYYTAVSNIQSVEHFVCDHCGDGYYD